MARQSPFSSWRDQQHTADPGQRKVALTAAREARRDLAIMNAVEAHFAGDHVTRDAAIVELLRVDRRVKAEQAAEHGDIPDTLEGCVAVLNVAARIVELAQMQA